MLPDKKSVRFIICIFNLTEGLFVFNLIVIKVNSKPKKWDHTSHNLLFLFVRDACTHNTKQHNATHICTPNSSIDDQKNALASQQAHLGTRGTTGSLIYDFY